jgi:uncharacterized membrane protein YgcG
MNVKQKFSLFMIWGLVLLLAAPPGVFAQQGGAKPPLKPEELEQLLAPIALYPDALLTQMLMASTYPLEVVQADRWTKQNKNMTGDALAKALDAQAWDPSVKSLVNFPQVLQMMSEKLDLTQKLGDAFLGQQMDVMAAIQKLRAKAQAAGNLNTTKEQVVKVEKEVIIIESPSPTIIYVSAYNPTVVYGAWAYPAYPPYPYYPPGYTAGAAFVTGVAVGAAWGYAWGNANWHGGTVNVNVNQNTNINSNINRAQYQQKYQGQTGQYNQLSTSQQVQARQAYRGYTGSALTPSEQQQAQQKAQQQQAGQQAQQAQQKQTAQQAASDRSGAAKQGGSASALGGGAFEGMDKGSSVNAASARGSSSRGSMSSEAGAGRSGGGAGGGGGRSGGGGRRR